MCCYGPRPSWRRGPSNIDSGLDSDVRERDGPGVHLHSDEPGIRILALLPAAELLVRVGLVGSEDRRGLSVQRYGVAAVLHRDLVRVPHRRRETLRVRVVLLPSRHPQRDLVDRARAVVGQAVGLVLPGVAPGLLVDLDFIPRVDRDRGRIAWNVGSRRAGENWLARITEPHEDTRVVVVVAPWMRQREVEAQGEVIELLRG